MKSNIVLSIVVIASLLAIVLVSGCTGSDTVMLTSTVSATPTPTVSQSVTSSSFFDTSQFTWYQYNITPSYQPNNMIYTYRYSNETIDGQPARHVNITMDTPPDMLTYIDIWTSQSDGSILKAHETSYSMGQLSLDANIAAANYSSIEGDDLASHEFTTAQLTPAPTTSHYPGYANVTFANTTYKATKYTGSSGSLQYTFFVVKSVPVPLKFAVLNTSIGVGQTYYLTAWGNTTNSTGEAL